MDISEIKQKKEELESALTKVLQKFEEDTGVSVHAVNVVSFDEGAGNPRSSKVAGTEVDLKLL